MTGLIPRIADLCIPNSLNVFGLAKMSVYSGCRGCTS